MDIPEFSSRGQKWGLGQQLGQRSARECTSNPVDRMRIMWRSGAIASRANGSLAIQRRAVRGRASGEWCAGSISCDPLHAKCSAAHQECSTMFHGCSIELSKIS
jgi:hypothetical protein